MEGHWFKSHFCINEYLFHNYNKYSGFGVYPFCINEYLFHIYNKYLGFGVCPFCIGLFLVPKKY